MFGGFGPIVAGIVYAILERTVSDFSLSGTQVLLAIVSTYMIAFVQAGASVFNQIEEWPLPKSLLCHFLSLYAVYVIGYLINTWIPFQAEVVLVFTGITSPFSVRAVEVMVRMGCVHSLIAYCFPRGQV